MTLLYVDVSHHDRNRRGGPLDWQAIRSVTSPVMCARATYGDPAGFSPDTFYFAEFQRGARAAGFTLCGGYHNLVRGDGASMRRQVDWLRSQLDSLGCDWAMLDIERYKELVERDLWPRWDDVRRFRDAWHAVESRPLAYYLPQWLYNGYYGGADLRELPGPLIQSHYAGGDGTAAQIYANAGGDSGTGWDDAYGGRLPDIWQFTSDGNVSGASDRTDVNAFRGTYEQLRALITGDDMDQNERLVQETGWEYRTVGHTLADEQNLRNFLVGEAPSPRPGEEGPMPGSPAWNVAHLPELLKQHAAAPVDPAALAALVEPMLAAMEARLEAKFRDAVADLGEGGAAAVRADQA